MTLLNHGQRTLDLRGTSIRKLMLDMTGLDKGWTKELNRISWNGGEPKYDIRDWAPEHEKMGKGVTIV